MIQWFNNLEPKTRFYIVYSILGLAQIFALTFPLAYILDKLFSLFNIRKWNPLWFVLDDSRFDEKTPTGLAEDYRIYLKDYKWKWIGVLAWHITRNRVWNLVDSFPVDNGNPQVGNQRIIITKMVSDNYRKYDGTKIQQGTPYAIGAGLKFVGEPGDNPWQVNRGDIISKQHSIIGDGEIYYKTPSGWKGWRRSYCVQKRIWWLFGAKRWHTFFMGTNDNRYGFKSKLAKLKPWGDWE